jgi:uncharacterized protein
VSQNSPIIGESEMQGKEILEILVCPAEDHGHLSKSESGSSIECQSCGRCFPIVDGIPVLLLDETETAQSRLA